MTRTAADVMGARGDDVATARPGETLGEVVQRLTARGIGAVVVVGEDRKVLGVLSERDVVRRLAAAGPPALDLAAHAVMTREVVTCDRSTDVDELMRTMTEGRFRHVPVVEDGRLVGIVSVGDVVKARLEELAGERDQLREYVTGSY